MPPLDNFAASADLNESLLELTPDGIFFLDRSGKIIRSNQACARLLDYSAEELAAMPFRQVVPKSQLEMARSIFERTLQGRPQHAELLLESKSHRIFAVRVQTVPYRVGDDVLGVIGTAQDLERIRAMEQALGDSESLLRLVMRLAHLGRWAWDESTKTIQASPELFELMGWDPVTSETITVDSFLADIVPDDREAVQSAMTRAIEVHVPMSVKFRIRHGRNTPQVYVLMAEPRHDPAGNFLGLIGMIQDVTEVSQLSESQQQLAAIFEHSQDLVMVVDLDAVVRYFNRTSRRTLGIAESLGHLSLVAIRAGRDEQAVAVQLQEAMDQGVWHGELWLRHRDGHAIPVSAVIQCHRDDMGRPRFFSVVARDVTHERALEDHIRYQAAHDTLTGLLNRDRFTELLDRYLKSLPEGVPTTVGFMDLNDFKQINDIHGHSIGDRLLAEVASRLSRHFDRSGILARWGGDEFTFWLPELGTEDSLSWLDGLVPDLERPYVVNDTPFECIPAVGLATFPNDGEDVETLVRKADAAMFEAKRRGIPYLFHTEAMTAEANRRQETREALKNGIRNHEFLAYFQPVIAAASGRLESAEALVRWNHPVRGILVPSQFIAEAERSALIIPLGQHMLDLACQALSQWHRQGHSPLRLAINLSARQLAQDKLALTIREISETYALHPSFIECEITETAILENRDLARRTLDDLRSFGFRILLDDFGTGYSSLSHLRDLPIDGIKLDRSFVEKLPDQPRETAIARSTIRLAHDLDLTVTAEGVETFSQAAFLTQEGCDFLQGYGISPPLDGEAFLKWRQDYRPRLLTKTRDTVE